MFYKCPHVQIITRFIAFFVPFITRFIDFLVPVTSNINWQTNNWSQKTLNLKNSHVFCRLIKLVLGFGEVQGIIAKVAYAKQKDKKDLAAYIYRRTLSFEKNCRKKHRSSR